MLRPINAGNLTALPAGLSRLTALRSLALSGVALEEDEAGLHPMAALGCLPALQELRLLNAGPPDLTRLPTSLTSLALRRSNPDDGKWDALGRLPRLAHLDLRQCGLVDLPAPVAALPALRTLLLCSNDLRALPDGAYLSSLERLDLEDNE